MYSFSCWVWSLFGNQFNIYNFNLKKKLITKYQSNNFPMQIRQEIHNGFIFYLPDVCTTAENKKGR